MTTKETASSLLEALTAVRDNRRFWPDEATFRMAHQIIPVAATEVAVVKDGKLLLQYREFADWPAPYNRPGWYIPGGYIPWMKDLKDSCEEHLKKDLKGEYARAHVEGFNLDSLKLTEPVIIGTKKWMPGEHPYGAPISLICVSELAAGDIVETEWLKWHNETIPTDVPNHQKFQDMVFGWLDSPPEFRQWQKALAKLIA